MARPKAARASKPTELTERQKKARARNAKYHAANRERSLQRMRDNYRSQTPGQRALREWRKRARPSVPRPGSVRAQDPRTVALGRAFYEWSDIDEVVRMYLAAAIMTELTGEMYVVDHIVPLISPFICGLHTHTNMQVITQAENMRKGNWAWPGMTPMTYEEMMEVLEALEKHR